MVDTLVGNFSFAINTKLCMYNGNLVSVNNFVASDEILSG